MDFNSFLQKLDLPEDLKKSVSEAFSCLFENISVASSGSSMGTGAPEWDDDDSGRIYHNHTPSVHKTKHSTVLDKHKFVFDHMTKKVHKDHKKKFKKFLKSLGIEKPLAEAILSGTDVLLEMLMADDESETMGGDDTSGEIMGQTRPMGDSILQTVNGGNDLPPTPPQPSNTANAVNDANLQEVKPKEAGKFPMFRGNTPGPVEDLIKSAKERIPQGGPENPFAPFFTYNNFFNSQNFF